MLRAGALLGQTLHDRHDVDLMTGVYHDDGIDEHGATRNTGPQYGEWANQQHAAVFMAGAGYTMLYRGHVNVDVLYGRMSPRGKAWVDILGTLVFLFPWLAVVAITSAPFVLSSWSIREASSTAGGMPAMYLLKSLLWVFCLVLFVQGLALIIRRGLFLAGRGDQNR